MAENKRLKQNENHYFEESRHYGASAYSHFEQSEAMANQMATAGERNLNLLKAFENYEHETSALREEDREQVRRCSVWAQNEVTAYQVEMNSMKSQSVDRQYANELVAKQKADVEWQFEQREQVRTNAEANVAN